MVANETRLIYRSEFSNESSLPRDPSSEVRAGTALVGDDFAEEQLSLWFAQEQEAFFSQDAGNSDVDPWYRYMRYVNEYLGFSKLQADLVGAGSVLVLGPGSGLEIERFAANHRNWSLCFVEASANFRATLVGKWPRSLVVEPATSGDIALASDSQDLVCAFSVLHHIPNVSAVMSELYRVIKPGGYAMIREPCSSMGDWRYPRSATPNERGISRRVLSQIAATVGFDEHAKPVPILFEPLNKMLVRTIGFKYVPFGLLYALDRAVSRLISFNDYYWRDRWYKKLGPSSYYYILRKP